MDHDFKLISFDLCPFVQRSVITLKEKGVPFDIEYIDLKDKPDWFLEISPLGKVPVLVVDDKTVLFESAVINEYLDEVTEGSLLPKDSLKRAYGRAWIEFGSNLIVDVYRMRSAKTEDDARKHFAAVRDKLGKLDEQLPDEGPFFYGESPSLVDFAITPALMRAGWIAKLERSFDFFEGLPKVQRWADALLSRPSVGASVALDIEARFHAALKRAEAWVGRDL